MSQKITSHFFIESSKAITAITLTIATWQWVPQTNCTIENERSVYDISCTPIVYQGCSNQKTSTEVTRSYTEYCSLYQGIRRTGVRYIGLHALHYVFV